MRDWGRCEAGWRGTVIGLGAEKRPWRKIARIEASRDWVRGEGGPAKLELSSSASRIEEASSDGFHRRGWAEANRRGSRRKARREGGNAGRGWASRQQGRGVTTERGRERRNFLRRKGCDERLREGKEKEKNKP